MDRYWLGHGRTGAVPCIVHAVCMLMAVFGGFGGFDVQRDHGATATPRAVGASAAAVADDAEPLRKHADKAEELDRDTAKTYDDAMEMARREHSRDKKEYKSR